MANKDAISDYFKLLKKNLVKCDFVNLHSNGEVIQESMNQKRVYLAKKSVMQWSKACLHEKSKQQAIRLLCWVFVEMVK